MVFFKKFHKIALIGSVATASGGAGWLYYQFRRTQAVLSSSLDASVLSLEQAPNLQELQESPFLNVPQSEGNAWTTLKFTFAKHLLSLAGNDNSLIRKKAVRQLAKIRSLEHWHFLVLAQMMDARTAVGLARDANTDPRLFPQPFLKYPGQTKNMIVTVMKEFLVNLHERSQHPCMGYFISKAFMDLHDVGRFSDYDSTPLELKKYIQTSQEVLPMCLESLLHHASLGNYAKDIAELNGLPLLMEIYNRFQNNNDVIATISRIISYLSMQPELLEELFQSGWVGVLAQWVKHNDVKISIPAAKALANLDSDEESVYLQRIYPLHPATRVVRKFDADVVFVHGLLGGVFFTWRQRVKRQDALGDFGKKNGNGKSIHANVTLNPFTKVEPPKPSDPDVIQFMEDLEEHIGQNCICTDYDVVWEDIPINTNHEATGPYCCPGQEFIHNCRSLDCTCYTYCWPRDWLAQDCANLRVVGINYETNLSMWTPICPIEKVKTLDERADELILQLKRMGLGQRPIVWVTHSMGGLMVKNIICKAYESADPDIKKMCFNSKGIVFYSTPHAGSSLAKMNQASALVVWPSVEVQELQLDSPKLRDIHEKFKEINEIISMNIITFIETQPTVVTAMKFKFLIVEPYSGNPGIGEYYEIPLDHLGICKPASRHSFIYQKVLHLIQNVKERTR